MEDQKALFLDRDGVINIDYGYVYKPEDCTYVDGIFNLCREAKKFQYKLIVVTNQSGIGRGYFTEQEFLNFMEHMKAEFSRQDCPLDDIFYCPFHENGLGKYRKASFDRKPEPGMILKAAKKHNLNLSQSVLIGDGERDLLAGKRAGVGWNILVKDQIPPWLPYIFPSLEKC